MTETHDIRLEAGGHDFGVRVDPAPEPDGARIFTPEARDAINRNYLVDRADDPNGYAFPGGHDLAGLPPVLMINADLDSLRPSGEAFVGELAAAGVDVRVVRVRGAMHGYLDEVGHPASELTIALLTETLSRGR